MEKTKILSSRNIAWFAVLLALTVLLQLFGSYIKIGGTTFSFVLIPIVLGGLIMGPLFGTLLGFAFGLTTLLAGVFGMDAFTSVLFNESPWITALICIGKGTAAGAGSALLYKLIRRKNKYAAVFTAAAAAPVINTGLFILGALLLSDVLKANFVADGTTVIYFLVIGCAGINFLVELALNLVLAPTLYRLDEIAEKRKY